METYLDSSVIVSLHVQDSNSSSALRAMAEIATTPLISSLSELEVVNAVGLQAFRKHISNSEAIRSIQKFRDNLRLGAYNLLPIPGSAFDRAIQLSQTTTQDMGTGSADILHIAIALELQVKQFFSFDQQQRKLAATVGLTLNAL